MFLLSSCCVLPDSTVRLSAVIPLAASSCITLPLASSFSLLLAPLTVMPLLPSAILPLVAVITLSAPAASVLLFRLTLLPAVMLPAPLDVMLPVVTFTSLPAVILLAPPAVTVPAFRLTLLPLTVTSPPTLMLPLPVSLPKFTSPSRLSLAFPLAVMLSTTRPASFVPAPCR